MSIKNRSTRDLLALVSLLFFASGSTGLAYEVIWSKRFTHVWGSSTLAMASVVAAFLFGLGLGAWLFGRVADRVARPLAWYGAAEIAIGLLALAIPAEIIGLARLANSVSAALPAIESLRFLIRMSLTLAVIGPPCVLMGGTLPLLIRQFTPREGNLNVVTGWLYAINTFGAATGCATAGFYLLPAWGLQITNYATASANIVIGAVSLLLSKVLAARLAAVAEVRTSPQPRKSRTPISAPVSHGPAPSGAATKIYLAALLTGLAALMLQMVWVRQLALVLGGSTYAFTATLFIVLVAIAVGSLLYQLVLSRYTESPALIMAVVVVVTAASLIGTLALPWLSQFVGDYRNDRFRWSVNAGVSILAGGIVQFVPGVGMGILFPLLVGLTRAQAALIGKTVGNIYAWNTLGSIVGATLTFSYLVPLVGTIGTIALALALYFVAGGLMLRSLAAAGRPRILWGSYATAALLILVGTVAYSRVADPLATNLGMYLYGSTQGVENLKILSFREGSSCNVLVVDVPAGATKTTVMRSLRVNGKIDASTGADMENQLGTAFFPHFFAPHAKEVLLVGFGSGTTPGASLLFPDVQVTCCEIEPAVYEASPHFASINHSPEKSDRLTMVLGDGRSFLQTSHKKYDLIINEPSNPWLAGVSNLFTREYAETARNHLKKDGIMVQWIQTYNFALADYTLVARTLRTVFPHIAVITLSEGADTLLLASMEPVLPTTAELDALQKTIDTTPAIRTDLKTWFHTANVRHLILGRFLTDERGLDQLIAQDPSRTINTDLNMKLEFDAPLRLFSRDPPEVSPALRRTVPGNWLPELAVALGYPTHTPEHHLALGFVAAERKDLPLAARHYQDALALDADYSPALRELADVYPRLEQWDQATSTLNALLRLEPQNAEMHARRADVLNSQRRPADAIASYRQALRLDPKLTGATNNLAWILATHADQQIRDGREALQLARQACESTDAIQAQYLDTLAAAHAELGQFEEAIKVVRSAQRRATAERNAGLLAQLQQRLEIYQRNRPYREKSN